MIVVYTLLLAGLSSFAIGQNESPECEGQGKETRFRYECSNVASLTLLGIPPQTFQLSITGNQRLTRIGRDDLSGLVNLDKLNLSGNAISVIEDGAFRNLQKLTKLDLSNNRLAAINNSMFAGLTQLKRLFLANNPVRVIERGGFSSLSNVVRLLLSHNLITTLPERVFDPLTQLSRIEFSSPNLQCNCQLKWLIKWISESAVNVMDTKCASPSNLQNVSVKNLNRDNLKCEWPVDLKVFELQPSGAQLVYAGDSLPIDCRVSANKLVGVYWYRLGKQVVSNSTAKIEVTRQDTLEPGLVVLTLTLHQLTTVRSGSWSCIAETADGNVTKSTNIVVAPAFCPQKIENTSKGQYLWPKTGFGTRPELACKTGNSGAKAFYSCNNRGQWVDLDLRACKYNSKITQLLKELSTADFNVTTNLDMVKTLVEYTEYIKDKMDVIFVSRVLRKISSSYDLYVREEIPQMVYNITSLMMNVNSSLLLAAEKEERACTHMRENLEMVVSYVLQSKLDFSLYMDNIALQARRESKNLFVGLTCIVNQYAKQKRTYLPSNFYCTEEASSPDLTKSTNQKVDALVHIPREAAKFASQNDLKVVVIIYRNDKLFQIVNKAQNSSKYFIPSSVISARIIGANVRSLSSSVILALPRQDYLTTVPSVRAVYWNESEHKWKTNGCHISNTVEQANHNLSMVECDHMTSYTLLQERAVAKPLVEEVEVFMVLKPQFYVGAVFLCICLLAIIFTYICSYRTISLSRKLKHSLINTCFSILFLKIIFILGVKIRQDLIACKVIGMAIHYFSITTIFWITVTTWNIYKKISGRGHHRVQTEEGTAPLPPNPMLKFYLFAWGIPVIICGITGAVNINFYSGSGYCFVAWKPGLLAFYGVVGLFILVNCILYICICSARRENHTKVYMDEMVVLNSEGCFEPHHIDDTMSNTDSIKSSVADSEYRPLAQLTGIIIFLMLYLFMWASGAFSIALPFKTNMDQLDVILSFLYMILCIILGIFLVAFYCLARNDTRSMWAWHSCCKFSEVANAQPPRSSTNINVISHANAHSSLKQDDDSMSSLKTSSVNNPTNPLLQIMQYHKKTALMSHSVSGSQNKGEASVQGSPEDVPVFYNPRQNGVAKKYWERKRTSREHGMNSSMMSVPETSRLQTHSPTNTEPTQHMSIEIQIKSHSSKQARRHRLGSTNSEPADVRNNIYHSMPKSPHQLNMPSQGKRREPTIGQSKTPSEGSRDNSQFSRYPSDMWQHSVPREYNHTAYRSSPHVGGYVKQPAFAYERGDSHKRPPAAEALHKQSYVHSYIKSMKDTDNSDDESRYSHRSRRSTQQSRPRHRRHRQHLEADDRQLTSSLHNESRLSLKSHNTARSFHSAKSSRSSSHRHKGQRIAAEENSLIATHEQADSPQQGEEEQEEERLNINHSSSDNNSSHYACTPLLEAKTLNTHIDIQRQQAAGSPGSAFRSMQNVPSELMVDMTVTEHNPADLTMPEERIYENAHKIMQHEWPVYTNLEELRLQAAAKHSPRSPEPPSDEYELPVYENLFSLNEYDTLKKQKHNVNKGLPLLHQGSRRNLQSASHSDMQNHDSSL